MDATIRTSPVEAAEIGHVLSQYLRTLRDFIIVRPKRFVERHRTDSEMYTAPSRFLIWNLCLTVVTSAIAFNYATGTSHSLTMGFGMGLTPLLNVVVVVYGRAVAALLLQPVRFKPLLIAFCYSSAWLPFYLPACVVAIYMMKGQREDLAGHYLYLMIAVQFVYLIYLIAAMGRFSGFEGPGFRSFVILMASFVLILNGGAGAVIFSMDERDGESDGIAWNIASNDRSAVRISTIGVDPRDSWHSAAAAKPGDVVALDIYYHQASEKRTAQDVRMKLELPSMIRGSGLVGAQIWSLDSGGRRAEGYARLRTRSARPITLKFLDAWWYADQGPSGQRLPAQAHVADLLSASGLDLGAIRPGCAYRGDLVVWLQVLDAEGKPPLVNPVHLTGSATCLAGRPTVTLEWENIPAATQYMVFRDNKFVETVAGTRWVDNWLIDAGSHAYHVVACDDAACDPAKATQISVQSPTCSSGSNSKRG